MIETPQYSVKQIGGSIHAMLDDYSMGTASTVSVALGMIRRNRGQLRWYVGTRKAAKFLDVSQSTVLKRCQAGKYVTAGNCGTDYGWRIHVDEIRDEPSQWWLEE